MATLSDLTRYRDVIRSKQGDSCTRIRLADQIRLAVKEDPSLLQKLEMSENEFAHLPE